ncbi:siderophore-interacting protein [Plantactinospora endophytica]|uniref:Siderophore-interacting protein n=1 Tax=Plantactinospora endophytica TaxID=673535 RepID=A0ABQ4DVF8_9ACTN|nr:siderophore-interacting protein [Plantactinospora endophytica]GIG86435.1 siderophore-interacting protein [Plantactinospora endophytica]
MKSAAELLFLTGTVEEVEPLTRRMRRVRVTGDRLRTVPWLPGQHVRVNVTPPRDWLRRPGDARRSYSVWELDRDRGSLDLCVLDHGDGPGAAWARNARPGQPISLSRPEGRLTLRESAYHLFVGDETAAVPFAAMLRALPARTPAYGVLVTDRPDGEVPLPADRRLPWVHRGDADPADGSTLLRAVRALDLPDQPGVAYLAGEARTCQAVRDHLVRDRGWARRQVVVKPFWAPGRRGLD